MITTWIHDFNFYGKTLSPDTAKPSQFNSFFSYPKFDMNFKSLPLFARFYGMQSKQSTMCSHLPFFTIFFHVLCVFNILVLTNIPLIIVDNIKIYFLNVGKLGHKEWG